MPREKFVSCTLSRKQFDDILQLFYSSSQKLGDDRNKIKIVEFEGRRLVVKSFKIPNVINRIAYRFFRKSKAERSYLNAMYLQKNNVGTPVPLGYFERSSRFGFLDSYFISEYAEHDFTFRELINDESIKDKPEILKAFTRFMFKMHEAQIYFLDNSPGNTLISRKNDQYDFYLVDLNRMKFYEIPIEDRLKNFERLSPQLWMYEIMGAEYAKLANLNREETIRTMWKHVQDFQEKFQKKKRVKRHFKKLKGK